MMFCVAPCGSSGFQGFYDVLECSSCFHGDMSCPPALSCVLNLFGWLYDCLRVPSGLGLCVCKWDLVLKIAVSTSHVVVGIF